MVGVVNLNLNAIKEVFPDSRHQLCIFHLLKNGFKYIRKTITDKKLRRRLKKKMGKFFKTKDKRTVSNRITLFAKEEWLPEWIKYIKGNIDRILPAVGSRWIPTTNNMAERFFREFSRFFKSSSAHKIFLAKRTG